MREGAYALVKFNIRQGLLRKFANEKVFNGQIEFNYPPVRRHFRQPLL